MSFSGTKGCITKPKPGVQINPLHPLSRGLIGYWLFNEGAGSRTYDISGKGNHGTITNISPNTQGSGWGGSKFGMGLHFDWNDDYVDIGSDSSLDIAGASAPFTIIMHVNTKTIAAGNRNVYSKSQTASDYRGILLQLNADTIWARIRYNSTTLKVIQSGSVISTNKWYHIAFVRDSTGNLFLYLDGVQVASELGSYNWNVNVSDNAYIGRYNVNYFNGPINTTIIYNQAKTAAEIKQLAQHPFCNLLQIPVRRYSVAAPPVGAIMNQFQRANIGADLFNGVFA